MTIPPHNFTHSPVDEVTISLCYGEESPPVEIVIPSPYPGWGPIRERIEEIVHELPEGILHSCMLRYTDSFPLKPGDIPGDLVVIAPRIPSAMEGKILSEPILSSLLSFTIPEGNMEISYIQSHERMRLIFTVKSLQGSIYDKNSCIAWFDSSREAVHQMFDSVTTEELLHRIM